MMVRQQFEKTVGVTRATMKKHPGFKAAQAKIAKKSGVGMKRAGAILAASTRKAGTAAKRANPRLNRVKMPHGIGSHIKHVK